LWIKRFASDVFPVELFPKKTTFADGIEVIRSSSMFVVVEYLSFLWLHYREELIEIRFLLKKEEKKKELFVVRAGHSLAYYKTLGKYDFSLFTV
jgi:hypothetical protein